MDIFFIFDASGSMNEMGKIHLQQSLARCAIQLLGMDQEKYEDLVIHLYQWKQNISEITMQSVGDIDFLTAKGSSSLFELSGFLSKQLKDTEIARVLILSDGNFPNPDIVSFQNQLGSFSDLTIRTVSVGADADLFKLKKVSTNNTTYLSENIASAIDSTIFGSDEPLTAPVSTEQILQSAPAETEESEEDWDA